jgi:formate dehydrogenase (coenzyme F420) beta subunit
MIEQVKEHVRGLFDQGKISYFVGLKDENGNIVPHVFSTAQDVDQGFSLGDHCEPGDSRYALSRIAMTVVTKAGDEAVGVLLRGCDERALNELLRWNQIPATERMVRVGFACPAELAQKHECRKPFPEDVVAGEKTQPVSNASVQEITTLDLDGRLQYWKTAFDRCIKCYGCRDVCPVCFCNVCSVESDELIRTGDIPPENPIFHLTRAVHMAGRCIDCNLCTEACPAEIPLRTLYKKVAEIVQEEFDYLTGEPGGGKCPLNFLGPEPGHTGADK